MLFEWPTRRDWPEDATDGLRVDQAERRNRGTVNKDTDKITTKGSKVPRYVEAGRRASRHKYKHEGECTQSLLLDLKKVLMDGTSGRGSRLEQP